MRPHLVILGAEAIQPSLIFRIGLALADGLLQGPMHPLDFALGLGMAQPAVAQPDAQTHDPYRQLRQTPGTGGGSAGRAVVDPPGIPQCGAFERLIQDASDLPQLRWSARSPK